MKLVKISFFIFLIGFVLMIMGEKSKENRYKKSASKKVKKTKKPRVSDHHGLVATVCKDIMRKFLKMPHTADFPWHNPSTKKQLKTKSIYTIRSYVDSKNAFNATIRTNYTCVIEVNNKTEKYKVVKFDLK